MEKTIQNETKQPQSSWKEKLQTTVILFVVTFIAGVFQEIDKLNPESLQWTVELVSKAVTQQLPYSIISLPFFFLIAHLSVKERNKPPEKQVNFFNVLGGTFAGIFLVIFLTILFISSKFIIESKLFG